MTVTLPLVAPGILSGAIIVFVTSAGEFGVPFKLSAPYGWQTLTSQIFSKAVGDDDAHAGGGRKAKGVGEPVQAKAGCGAGQHVRHGPPSVGGSGRQVRCVDRPAGGGACHDRRVAGRGSCGVAGWWDVAAYSSFVRHLSAAGARG